MSKLEAFMVLAPGVLKFFWLVGTPFALLSSLLDIPEVPFLGIIGYIALVYVAWGVL